MIEKLREREHGRLRFEDWSMTDPLSDELHAAMYCACHYFDQLTKSEMREILRAANSYIHLASHPVGTEAVIKQLRAVRRAVKDDKGE